VHFSQTGFRGLLEFKCNFLAVLGPHTGKPAWDLCKKGPFYGPNSRVNPCVQAKIAEKQPFLTLFDPFLTLWPIIMGLHGYLGHVFKGNYI